ncbi:D-alanyl-D-alanine carboxypeptidase [Anaerotruncus sp. AF02-27]|nr:D-alanyl-D-alanine carboxypeptidase [Anaerotruncus sp. AF02-27]
MDMRKKIASLLTVIILCTALLTPASASSAAANYPPPFADELYCQAVYMLNLDSNSEVFAKNEQAQMNPSSLNKIMTCILALEEVADPDTETTELKAYIQNELYNLGVTQLGGIYMGEPMTIRDLMYAMMLQSANEAAMMIADYIGDGDIPYFCELMNKKAKEIGAKNTNFANPTGLYAEENKSTAYDLALIVQYAMQNQDFVDIVTTRTYTSQPTPNYPNGISWVSNNQMQNPSDTDYYYEGLKGVIPGALTELNMRNFASVATRDGYSYLLVVLGAPITNEDGERYKTNLAWFDTNRLYNWAFETFRVKTLMDIGEEVAEVGVRLSWDKDHIKLLAADKFASLVPNETTEDSLETFVEIDKKYTEVPVKGKKGENSPDTEKFIDAPVKKGEEIGHVKLMLAGEEVGRVRLVAAESVEQSKWLYYVDKVKSFTSNFLFKFVLTFLIVLVVLYIVLMIIRNRNRRRYQMRRRKPPAR